MLTLVIIIFLLKIVSVDHTLFFSITKIRPSQLYFESSKFFSFIYRNNFVVVVIVKDEVRGKTVTSRCFPIGYYTQLENNERLFTLYTEKLGELFHLN